MLRVAIELRRRIFLPIDNDHGGDHAFRILNVYKHSSTDSTQLVSHTAKLTGQSETEKFIASLEGFIHTLPVLDLHTVPI